MHQVLALAALLETMAHTDGIRLCAAVEHVGTHCINKILVSPTPFGDTTAACMGVVLGCQQPPNPVLAGRCLRVLAALRCLKAEAVETCVA